MHAPVLIDAHTNSTANAWGQYSYSILWMLFYSHMITCLLCNCCISYISVCIGCLVTSAFVVYAYFWLLYISHLALTIFYPLKSIKLFNSKAIYIIELSLVFVTGITPSIVSAALSHYEILFFPPTQCGNNDAIRFYEVILPTMICITICGILMLLILYKIHVVSSLLHITA